MKRHEMDPLSLVSGLMFTAIGAVFLFGRVDVAHAGAQWIWPALLVVAGGLLMVLTARPSRPRANRSETDADSAMEQVPSGEPVSSGEPQPAAPEWPNEV